MGIQLGNAGVLSYYLGRGHSERVCWLGLYRMRFGEEVGVMEVDSIFQRSKIKTDGVGVAIILIGLIIDRAHGRWLGAAKHKMVRHRLHLMPKNEVF